ncbi:MAG: Sec-independent protein translocase protein TatB [Thermodesulfovibrionales bacterium]|nr:Sec-independent protein translocase protein TatB [Thermodesulfovibrionales bacterium]
MFDLGFQELIVIFVVALLVFGPKKLPELAVTLGKAIRDLRQSLSSVKEQIDSEIHQIKDPIELKNNIYKGQDFLKEIDKAEEQKTKNKAEQTAQSVNKIENKHTEGDKKVNGR